MTDTPIEALVARPDDLIRRLMLAGRRDLAHCQSLEHEAAGALTTKAAELAQVKAERDAERAISDRLADALHTTWSTHRCTLIKRLTKPLPPTAPFGRRPAMGDKPILFSGPMVRALLDGRKTQTRRTHPPQPRFAPDSCRLADLGGRKCWFDFWANDRAETHRFKLPYAVGDRLYVREAHALLPRTAYRMSIGTGTIDQREHPTDGYSAAVFREGFDRSGRPKWRPGIHMPRWASRITLLVTEVRVERLQECSEADALAEGAINSGPPIPDCFNHDGGIVFHASALESYAALWDQINGPGAWAANPWVAAYTFTIRRQNIDQIGATP